MKKSWFMPLLVTLGLLVLSACAQKDAPPEQAAQSVDESAKLHDLVEQYWQDSLVLNPLMASFVGDNRYNDRYVGGISPQERAAELDLQQRYLDAAKALDGTTLGAEDRLTLELFVDGREEEIEGFSFPTHLLPISQFRNPAAFFVLLGSGASVHPFKTVKDYDDFLGRVNGFVEWSDQAIVNMREGVKQGVVQPRILMEKVLPQLSAQFADKAEDSMFWKPITDMPADFPEADKQRLQSAYKDAIETRLMPVYHKLYTFIEQEYLPKTRESVGMSGLPDGEQWYAYQVRNITTTDLTPEQIHEIGLREVARIQAEMAAVMEQVGFKGDMQAFFDYLNSDPKFYFTREEDLIAGYNALRERLDQAVPAMFSRMPKAGFEIRPVEAFRAKSASGGSYMSPTPDGSRPGVFYVNTYDLSARPSWAMESLFLHEAIPGHHFQGALAVELDQLPSFRRFGGYTAYSEGWGLYAESLGKELGMYQDPYQYFGALAAELWRAIRLVVDTGLHSKDWSRQQVLDYMYANTAIKEARAVSEAERYIAIPGQALAYKIGQLKIRELRTRSEKALGEKFDIKAFHAQVLEDGELPLSVLETKIDRWVASQL
jgi:uncharacterized protein (DUF885 family)